MSEEIKEDSKPEEVTETPETSHEEKEEASKTSKKSNKFLEKLKANKKKIIIITAPIVTLILVVLIGYFLKLDSYIIPSSLSGIVSGADGKLIADAKICIQNKCDETNDKGEFKLEKLKRGNHHLTISADSYKKFKEEISLKRNENKQDFVINFANTGTVGGTLKIAEGQTINITDMKILADEVEFNINEDFSFESSNIPVGKRTIKLESPFYNDKEVEIELTEDKEEIIEFELTSAIDIKLSIKNWLTNEDIKEVNVDFNSETFNLSADDNSTLKDLSLEESNNKTLTISKENFNNLTIEVKDLKEGLNEYVDLKLVPAGKVTYISNRTGSKDVYISNYDGSDEIALTGADGEENYSTINNDQTGVYFTSNRADSNKYLVYQVPFAGGEPILISTGSYDDNNGDIGRVFYQSLKRMFVKNEGNYSDNFYKLYMTSLDGSNIKMVKDIRGLSFDSYKPNNDGSFVIFSEISYNNNTQRGLYYLHLVDGERKLMDIADKESITVYDISDDNKYILVGIYDHTGETNLWKVGINDSVREKINDNSSSESAAQLWEGENKVLYLSNRDGKTDIYSSGFNDKREEKKMTNTGKISSFYFDKKGNIIYVDDRVLWVMDPKHPDAAKKITDSIFTGYGYYEY